MILGVCATEWSNLSDNARSKILEHLQELRLLERDLLVLDDLPVLADRSNPSIQNPEVAQLLAEATPDGLRPISVIVWSWSGRSSRKEVCVLIGFDTDDTDEDAALSLRPSQPNL